MYLNEFITNFIEQLDGVDASTIKADTEFKDLDEQSSMSALAVIAMVDAEYDVQIKGDDIRNAETIDDLFNRVKEIKG